MTIVSCRLGRRSAQPSAGPGKLIVSENELSKRDHAYRVRNVGDEMRWYALQHVSFEGPGCLEAWANLRGHCLTRVEVWKDSPLPELADVDGLFVLGGPMSVGDQDECPWLAAEKRFIAKALADGKYCIGICLGAQLLSLVAGGTVTRNMRPEIGWFPIQRVTSASASRLRDAFPEEIMAFHWHGDRASVPSGATHLARSAGCREQAFALSDRTLAFQFHLEATPESIEALIANCPLPVDGGTFVQSAAAMRRLSHHTAKANELLSTLLDVLCGM